MRRLPSLVFIAALSVLDIIFVWWVFSSGGDPAAKIFLGVVLASFSAVSTFALVRWVATSANGRLVIRTKTGTRAPGEEVSGTVELRARRELDVNELTVALIALTERGEHRVERWRDEQHPVGPMVVSEGVHAFAFSFDLPSHGDDRDDAGIGPLTAGSNTSWMLVAELNVPGVDVRAVQALRVAV